MCQMKTIKSCDVHLASGGGICPLISEGDIDGTAGVVL